jgi:hypothetical protein
MHSTARVLSAATAASTMGRNKGVSGPLPHQVPDEASPREEAARWGRRVGAAVVPFPECSRTSLSEGSLLIRQSDDRVFGVGSRMSLAQNPNAESDCGFGQRRRYGLTETCVGSKAREA